MHRLIMIVKTRETADKKCRPPLEKIRSMTNNFL